MDLMSIVQAVWRHKLATIPVFLLVALGVAYVMVVKPPVYQASSSILLIGPPNPPTQEQIAASPRLQKINTNNPYVNFNDLPVVADAVIEVVSSSSGSQALAQEGVSPQYQVVLSTDYGNPPIIEITGVGASPEAAIRSANLVTQAAQADLKMMQEDQGVDPLYMISTTELVAPHQATTKVSAKLRTLVVVLGLGAVMLLVAVSVADVSEKRRLARRAGNAGMPSAPERPSDHNYGRPTRPAHPAMASDDRGSPQAQPNARARIRSDRL